MNIRNELKSLDEKLQKLRTEYFKNNKRSQGEYLDSIYNRLQSDFINLEKEVKSANYYFENLLKEEK